MHLPIADLITDKTATLAISIVALLVAVYGVIERRTDRRRQARIRLSELIDELSGLQSEQATLESEAKLNRGVIRAANGRRQLLCFQAIEMLERFLGGNASSQEYVVLATSLARLGENAQAEWCFDQAINRVDSDSSFHAIAWRAYAHWLFEMGKVDHGRTAYVRSVESSAKRADDAARFQEAETHVYWAIAEQELVAGDETERSLEQLDLASAVTAKISHQPRRRNMSALIAATQLHLLETPERS